MGKQYKYVRWFKTLRGEQLSGARPRLTTTTTTTTTTTSGVRASRACVLREVLRVDAASSHA